MANKILLGLSSLLMPLGLYCGPAQSSGYTRSYLSANLNSAGTLEKPTASKKIERDIAVASAGELDILSATVTHELVVLDAAVPDKQQFYRALKPGVDIVEISSSAAGLSQLKAILANYKNLAAVHIVSHAQAGQLQLGSSVIAAETLKTELEMFAALNGAVRQGGDLLLYGCDLAANDAGEELLDIIQHNTHLDVAASDDLTGNLAQGADWDLEIQRGHINTELAFSAKALKDFSAVLVASNGTKNFQTGWVDNNISLTSTDFVVKGFDSGASPITNLSIYASSPFAAYLQNGYNTSLTGTYFHVAADGTNTGSFELTGLVAGEYLSGQFTNVRIVGIKPDNSTVTSSTINGTGSPNETFSFGAGQLTNFSGVKIKAFKLIFDISGSFNTKPYLEFRNFTITGALAPVPIVSDSRISISGATGTGGAYKIGDTVTATWNNTAGGDNNSGITGATVDFSQFGGGAAVVATNSSNTWTATYTITAGAIDTNNRNVSVTATNTAGNTTTADTTNATVDSIAPTVTDGRINISGATGLSGAYKIGDTVTATWNNTAGGDNNSDTISAVTVNFTDFGGGAAVAATNSSGTWTASYTIVSGAIDATNRNVTVSATDNAGNTTSTADSSNATVDNNAPGVSSILVSGSPAASDTSMAFTVTFDEAVGNLSTDDFTLVGTGGATGTIASVSGSSGSSVDVNITSISGNGTIKVNLNGSTNVTDDAGNSIPSYSTGATHTVAVPTAPDAPTIGTATAGDAQASVTFTAPGNDGGSAITTYTATASPGGATGSCAGPTACTITVGSLSNGTAYTFSVTATNTIGTGSASVASNSVTPMADQTITFAQPGNYNFGATPTLTATSDSGLTVSFSSTTTGVCTVTSGGALTFVTAGTCTIDADQAGDAATNAATTVTRSFSVNAIVPDTPVIGSATAGDQQATVTFTASASDGGANISGYTVTANPGGATGTGAGSPITVTGLTNGVAYTFTVTATNTAGTGGASAASNAVTPAAPQTITFANPGAQNFGSSPDLRVVNGGASATSGLDVTFTSSTTGVCTVTNEGVLTFVTVGTCTINANQAGNSSYLAASQISRSFTVNAIVPGAPASVVATGGDTQASVAFVAPVNTGGTTINGYTVTVSPADVAPVNGAGSPIVVTGLTNGIAYTFSVTAENSAGTGPASGASNSVTPAANQTITFANPGAQTFGTTPTLTATTDATGLTVTFTSSTTSVCTITSGGVLTFVTAGTCTINADQAGDASYLAATQVSRSFAVNAVIPGAPAIGTATAGNASATVSFTAPASSGGVAITDYTVTASPGGATATGSASPLTVSGLSNGTAYTFTVTATNSAGNSPASGASNSVTPSIAQTITFNNPGPQNFGTTPTLTATTDATGLSVTFTSSTTSVCTVTSGGLLTFVDAGTCTINADQPGDTNYSAATQVSRSFTVNAIIPDAPAIGTATAGNTTATVSFSASASNGGAVITAYTVTANPGGATATGSASPLTVSGLTNGTAYTFTVTATNSVGNSLASGVSNAITPSAPQSITFNNPGPQNFGTTPTLTATTDATGLTVAFTSSTTSVCTVTSGGQLTFVSAGTCTIHADQPGDTNYAAATQVSRSFMVNAVIPGAPASVVAIGGDTQASVAFVAPANTGGTTINGYTVTVSPADVAPVNGAGSPIVVTGLTNGTAYTFSVTAENSAGTGPASGASNSVTPAANQTITFANPGAQNFGTTPTLTATTDATGLTVTFTSSTTSVCTITSGGVLTFVTAGTCTINADQPGNASYLAAIQVSRSFSVNAVIPGAPTIGTATAGDTTATVSFSAPGTTGGAAITAYTVTASPGGATATGSGSPLTVSGLTNGITYTFTVTATNSAGTSTASAVSNAVTPEVPNSAPTIGGSPETSVIEGSGYSFVPAVSDADGDTLTFSISNKPAWASFSTSTGALSGTPGNADIGSTSGIVISVSDGSVSASLPAFNLTVLPANKLPVISGTPASTVEAGDLYSFTPVASDADAGDTLSFSISNKPAWASFNTGTGQLSGTPATTDIGMTSGIVISVTDGKASASLAAFNLTVKAKNVAPVASDSAATLEEDSTTTLTLTAQDANQDLLTYEIVSQPAHGSVTLQGATLTYTPAENFNGTDKIGFVAKDAALSSNPATISLTVTAVNDNPVVTDDSFNLLRTTNNQYQLAVLANDTDIDGDSLSIDGATSSVGTVSFNAQGLTLTAPALYVGPVSLRYTATDGKGGRGTATVSLTIAGGDAANLPVITVPADITTNATALYTRVPLGTATAVDRNGRRLRVSLVNGSLFFAPGEHIVYWQATDAEGNTATKAQKVQVNPLVSLSKDQLVTEGNEVEVQVLLNGPAPVYPVSVPYTVSGSAGGNDHTLTSGVAEISAGLSTTIRFNVLEDGVTEASEDIVVTLDSTVNRGSKRSSRIQISEANVAPVVSLNVQQKTENRLTVSAADGVVTVTATVTDSNPQDQLSGVWNGGTLQNTSADQSQFSFDPAQQGPGLYQISYTATDTGTPNLSATSQVFVVVRPALPVLGTIDSDGDLIPDNQEGFADSDADGIPDYQDAINECNVMPTELLGQTQFVAEGDPGVCLRLGTVAASTNSGGLQIAKDAVETDTAAVNIGGIYDFIAYGLPEQGKSYSLVIPQRLPVPANAVYRKFHEVTGWVNFVSNERNSVSSAAGERGFCPPPGGPEWSAGLTEGHWCVQVRVEDGGPNDADGIANSAIVDPGGVAVALNGNKLPVAVKDQASVRKDSSIDVNVLGNDTDADGDKLTVSQATSSFGTVTILADQKLSYKPNADFVGTDTVIYSITDGKGGTASSELSVTVFSNTAPVAVQDSAATDDRSPILIDVLKNDTDADGDVLKVSAVSALQGTVTIETDQRLRYTPKAGFNGVDTISYTVKDGTGDTATSTVTVTVRAYQDVVVDNKSSGGSMTAWMLLALGAMLLTRRRSAVAATVLVLLSYSAASHSAANNNAQWYLQASAGFSSTDAKQHQLAAQLPTGSISAFDDSDQAFGLSLGYQLNHYVALELGYQDSGEASSQISADSLTPQQYHEQVKAVSPVLTEGWTVAARFTPWQHDLWSLDVPVGIINWDHEISSSLGNTSLTSKQDGTDWFAGVQLNYRLNTNWQAGLGYQQQWLDANNISSWLLSARYGF